MQRAAMAGANVAVLGAIYLVVWWAVRSPLLALHPNIMGPAVAVDLVLIAAAAHYLVGVRWAGFPRWTVSVVAILGAVVAGLCMPGSHAWGLVGALVAGVELTVGGLVLWRLAGLVRKSRTALSDGTPLLQAVEQGLAESLESALLASAVMTEIRLLTLSITGPFRRAPRGPHVFSVHKESGWTAVAAALVGLSFVEVPFMHLVLDTFVGPWAAWTATALGAYGVLWLMGDAHALRLYPTEVRDGVLRVRIGTRWRADIPLAHIRSAKESFDAEDLDLSVLGAPNLRLELSQPVQVVGLFSVRKRARVLSMQVDDVQRLIECIER